MQDKDWIFAKLPNWLRWVLALPSALILCLIIPIIARFCFNWTFGDNQGVLLFDILVMVSSTFGFIIGIYYCVPKFKNQISGVTSIILAIYFGIMTALYVERGFPFGEIIKNIVSGIASIYMSYILLRNKED